MIATTFILMLVAGAESQALPPEVLWDNNLEIDFHSLFPLSPPLWPDLRFVEDVHVGPGGWLITGYAYSGAEDDGWLHSGFTEVFVLSGSSGSPGELIALTSGPHERIATGEALFGRDGYEYYARELRILLPPGPYWIGGRDAQATGEGSNYISSSDGGPDGGCPPDYPEGTCTRYFVSPDCGETWLVPILFEHLAIQVIGLASPGDFNGDNDVDLNDFAAFDNCVTGPGEVANVSCRLFDFDDDEDVDFTDFQVMQIVFAWE